MTCITKIAHEVDSCGSSDGLQIFYNEEKDNYTGYCFACSTFEPQPYKEGEKPEVKVKTKEEILAEILEIKELKFVDKEYRGIPAGIYKKWGVRLGLSEYDGKTPFAIYYKYMSSTKLVGWKARMLPKKNFWSVGLTKGADPFGWNIATKIGGKRIYVTEGEQDAMALDFALIQIHRNTNYSKRRYAIISLPNGVDSVVKTLKKIRKAGWEEIVMVMDGDGAGKEAIKKAQKVVPDVLMIDMPPNCKDPNDAVVSGQMKLLVDNCLWNTHKPPIQGVIQVSDVLSKALKKPTIGLTYPIDALTEMTYGQRFGEAVAIGSGVGLGKSAGYNTPMIMFDGTVKMVQNIVDGDELMGDDSTKRVVSGTNIGEGEMFKITPIKGDTWTCNLQHILAIYVTNMNDRDYLLDADKVKHKVGKKSLITVDTYLRSSKKFKLSVKMYKVGVEFKETKLMENPYLVGAFLADGSKGASTISLGTKKEEVLKYIKSIHCTNTTWDEHNNCNRVYLSEFTEARKSLLTSNNERFIPQEYLINSRESRLQLLAGLLDCDGHLSCSGFELTAKDKCFADQVTFLARSLGFAVTMSVKVGKIKSVGFEGTYYRLNIYGDTDLIPNKVKYKQAKPREQIKDHLITGFKIEPIGIDKYYGIAVDKNRLYLLGDFTVTHNTLLAHECAAHNITVHKEPVFMVLLEEQNHDTLRNVAGKIDSIPYHKPDAEFDIDQFRNTAESLQNKLILWEADADQHLRFDLDEIIKAIRFNVAEFGTRFIVIDNMTRLVDHLEPSEANTFINKYSSEIEGLASQLDIHIDVYSHLNNTGKISHEAGGKALASQFTGSRGLMRSFPMMLGFERNKHAKGGDSCKSFINVLKNRKYGGEGLIKTQYIPETGRLLGNEWEDSDFLESNKH